ncbi:MAG TPA: hypothetical protein VGR61_10110 [Candidatus Dormibacteraeota bacterium]|nr:hypothetical protein [Candidatus Dormibacteraeota bacterium]
MRRTVTSLAAVLLAISAAPISGIVTAHAANVSATCADIGTKLSTASTGDVITLGGGVLCPGPYAIKTGSAITLQGATTSDGFDGMGTNVILQGNNNGRTTIRNLIFKNGTKIAGAGAINLDGDVFATITANTFLGNSGTAGGAIFISATTIGDGLTITNNRFGSPGLGNASTGVGGAVRASVEGVTTISDNVFDSNTASASGGGVFAATFGAGSRLDFSRNQLLNNSVTGNFGSVGGGAELEVAGNVTMNTNVFRNNSLAVARRRFGPANLGGGVDLHQLSSGLTLTQSHNLFVGNSVASISDGSLVGAGFDFGGGGEFAQFTNVNSLDDVFNSNTVGNAGVKTTPVGGGLAVQGFGSGNKVTLTATNLVLTNNSTGLKGEGGGAYAGFVNGCRTPPCTAEIDLFDSTVDGNTVGVGGQGAGLNGNQTDTARVVNSIVYGNSGTVKQIDGFGTIAVNHTDSCSAAATAYPPATAGNICLDPLLANVAGNNVHETAASLTKDAGDSGQVAAAVTSDYEGDPRIQGARVDMGADEVEVAPTPTPALPKAGASAAHVPLVPAALVVLLSLVAPLVVRGARRRRGARSGS